ncbi:histone H1-like repetitive region-containing protein [Mariprofundus micogutta]|nr:histone H1-like repetitive region-containing protein [Mariprofundus micogutta]
MDVRWMMFGRLLKLQLLALVLMTPLSAFASSSVLYVVDSSGSMWSKVDGTEKVYLARNALSASIARLPLNVDVGLAAYGYSKKGDCSDVAVLAPLGSSRASIMKKMNSFTPKGMTPLSRSIDTAVNEIKSRGGKGTVVFLSDGAESCRRDPCKAASLSGDNIRIHVVGFGVKSYDLSQLQCVAANGGGKYFAANDTKSLTAAFASVAREIAKDNVVPAKGSSSAARTGAKAVGVAVPAVIEIPAGQKAAAEKAAAEKAAAEKAAAEKAAAEKAAAEKAAAEKAAAEKAAVEKAAAEKAAAEKAAAEKAAAEKAAAEKAAAEKAAAEKAAAEKAAAEKAAAEKAAAEKAAAEKAAAEKAAAEKAAAEKAAAEKAAAEKAAAEKAAAEKAAAEKAADEKAAAEKAAAEKAEADRIAAEKAAAAKAEADRVAAEKAAARKAAEEKAAAEKAEADRIAAEKAAAAKAERARLAAEKAAAEKAERARIAAERAAAAKAEADRIAAFDDDNSWGREDVQHRPGLIYSDEFDSGYLSEHWQVENPAPALLHNDHGNLILMTKKSSIAKGTVPNLLVLKHEEVYGDYVVSIKMDSEFSTGKVGKTKQEAGLLMYKKNREFLALLASIEDKATFSKCGGKDCRQVVRVDLIKDLDGSRTYFGSPFWIAWQPPASTAMATRFTVHLKITKLGFEYTASASLDGKDWYEVGKVPLYGRDLNPAIFASSNSNYPYALVKFDHIKISRDGN